MKRICIESPLSGDFVKNIEYARRCMRYVLDLGYAPFVSHLLYTQVLDDRNPEQRKRGLEAGFAMGDSCDERWFFLKGGRMSDGMLAALDRAKGLGQDVRVFDGRLDGEPDELKLPEVTPTPGVMRLSPGAEQRLRMVSSALGNARLNLDAIFRELDGDEPR